MDESFLIGTGICDITGPAAESAAIGLKGTPKRIEGIHTRLYARSFMIQDAGTNKIVVIVIADLWSCTQAVKTEIVKRLKHTFGSDVFSDENILISGTHTHNGPGGYSHYVLYNLTSKGFDKQNFEAIVGGITESIINARNNLAPGKIFIRSGKIEDCGWNRSPDVYLNNPEEERKKYDGDTDKDILVLKFKADGGKELGCLNWKAIHSTGLGRDDSLISGNNKGYAEYLFEKALEDDSKGKQNFIAAFANSNCGDVSGDIISADSGDEIDIANMYELGRKQFFAAWDIYNLAKEELSGILACRHNYINMSNLKIKSSKKRTYPAAIGLPAFSNPQYAKLFIDSLLKICTRCIEGFSYPDEFPEELKKGHGAKSIVLAPGLAHPYPLSPEILPVQIIRIGSLAILAVPGEISTMAGRRLREAIINILKPAGVKYIAISAYANAFAGHITTKEEYDKQGYEGALTHFGPYTLDAYIQEFTKLADSIKDNKTVTKQKSPDDLTDLQFYLQPPFVMDSPASHKHKFGSINKDADTFYKPGDSVEVIFWGAHPRNNLRSNDSYLKIEKKENRNWVTEYTDRDPCTMYKWSRELMASSLIKITWMIDNDVKSGEYRIRHQGEWKDAAGKITPYEGISGIFRIGTGLRTNELLFRNICDNKVDLMFYHPGDRLRLVPYKSYSLKPLDIYTWTIPPSWEEVQIILSVKNQKLTIKGRNIVTIKNNGIIKIESG